ncbi:cation transporter [Avibacterium paragallinarum]|uniref:Cation transporter n=1 Tax=Avibacterium paragallinarum TaxID=728 RepID=A0A0F5ET18_AVIPA|nr:cation transporter [Avibacterium paragallinarum]AZI14567.1 heavy metal transport/detoxification protein [Avibacterium paragallinarum]MEE3608954.1 cation transporter [Avibacterium paragallinarum]MEE3620672.1 cation transporter [Avibacterium paragallinarum]MEE3668279.1 cation transporter [Avibacterium paragallinarum]MEE3680850.1 cation transporter [Avibacterium paragallinarum]
MKTTVLALSELSCQHCVKSVQKVLEGIAGVQRAEVSLDKAIIEGEVDPQVLINAIVEAGYQARLADEAK